MYGKGININILCADTMKKLKENGLIHILNNVYCCIESYVDIPAGKTVELDLGCGKGGFSLALAERYPESLILSADIMIGRMRKLDSRIRRRGFANISLFRVEARHFVALVLPDASIDRLHILCPDPWPKHRHRHNRLLCSDFVFHICRVLKNSGAFHFSTDDVKYFKSTVNLIECSGLLVRDDDALSEISDLKTDFEKRWNAIGREVHHACWRKKMLLHETR